MSFAAYVPVNAVIVCLIPTRRIEFSFFHNKAMYSVELRHSISSTMREKRESVK